MVLFLIIYFMVKVFFYILQKIIIVELGNIIKLMALDNFITIKESFIKDNGLMIINKESEKNIGLTELTLKDILKMEVKNQESLFGQMIIPMRGNL